MTGEAANTAHKPGIGVIGGGAWGTALAQVMASDGRDVAIWAREAEVVDAINLEHVNPLFLPGIPLHANIHATGNLGDLAAFDTLLVVSPAQHLVPMLEALHSHGGGVNQDLVLCSKGIDQQTGLLMSETAQRQLPGAPFAILSGPTFAHEVAKGQPTAITLACQDEAQWQRLAPHIARPHFRPYFSDDLIGAQIGGAIKNVLAIACGVIEGLQLGENARASLISRGFAEMQRYGAACNARSETLAGLSGLGDLVLTCSSTQSRNFSLGKALGEGRSAADILSSRSSVAEGAYTAPILKTLAEARGVDMPIVAAVCALLDGSASAHAVVSHLLARPLRAE